METYKLDRSKLIDILKKIKRKNGEVYLEKDGIIIKRKSTPVGVEDTEIGRLVAGKHVVGGSPEELYLKIHRYKTESIPPNLLKTLREYIA